MSLCGIWSPERSGILLLSESVRNSFNSWPFICSQVNTKCTTSWAPQLHPCQPISRSLVHSFSLLFSALNFSDLRRSAASGYFPLTGFVRLFSFFNFSFSRQMLSNFTEDYFKSFLFSYGLMQSVQCSFPSSSSPAFSCTCSSLFLLFHVVRT